MTAIVEAKLKLLANSPGVYIMKDAKGRIIYVGKAIVLKNRVRQYFQSGKHQEPKVRAMVSKIADFETILTHSEVEALILECNLIKKHRPRYNINLKDDKSYPYLKVTLADTYPRLMITRRVAKDGSRYFGPYTSAGAMKESVKLLRRLFPLRTCKNMKVERPCLEYHIKRCLAPCCKSVDKDEYASMIQEICLFLEGRTEQVEKELTRRMTKAADAYDFERAARIRDQLAAVRKVAEKQNIVTKGGDQDAIGMARSSIGAVVMVFLIRAGKMVGREHFLLTGSEEETKETLLLAFLKQYYHRATFVPREILLPFSVAEMTLLEKWLSKNKGEKAVLCVPQRGTKHDVIKMARNNAEKFLKDEAVRITQADDQTIGAVKELGRYLGLKEAPFRMECFDISHNQGSETVASMVVFEGGIPKKSDYRRFKIKSAEGKPDDFLSMREVTARRYGKITAEELPNLIIIDGGKGQLSSALEIIRGAGHIDVPVIGIAEQFEHIFTEKSSEPLILPRRSQALYLIERIRDEAHRFAITYHRKLRSKRNLVSVLDHIVGIGPKRRKALWNHFGTLAKIKKANVKELAAVDTMTLPAAEAVKNFFLAQEKMLAGEK